MAELLDPVECIRESIDAWSTPYVELDVFGTSDAASIAYAVDAFCRHHLRSGVAAYLFYAASVGSTHGIELCDRRRVVLKVRPPPETNPDLALDFGQVATVCRVMTWLSERGFPCPLPLCGPLPIARGLATVEEFADQGEPIDAREPRYRRAIAAGYAELVALLRSIDFDLSCLRHFARGSTLYPQPHGKLFDFSRPAFAAALVDDFARRARALERHAGPPMLGHCDWRSEHVRFRDETIVATYDWDSLAIHPESELVGVVAHGFSTDWSRPEGHGIPTGDQIRGFLEDYACCREQPFTRAERSSALATCVYWIAYGARCTLSLEPDRRDWPPDTWPYLLFDEGEALLGEAATLAV